MTTGNWGSGPFGTSPWGGGTLTDQAGIPPVIDPLNPVDGDMGVAQLQPLTIRLTDDVGVALSKLYIVVSGVNWVIAGVAVNGVQMTSTPNSGNGFDLELIPPTPYPYESRQEVLVVAGDIANNVSSLIFLFQVGVGLRLLKARNPFENVILAYFNRQLAIEPDLFVPTHWVVTPLDDARPLTIVDVATRAGQSDVIRLKYVGGGGSYRLTAINVHDLAGDGIEHGYDSVEFEVTFDDQDEPTIRLFNSIWGPLGISQRTRTRRTMDEHVANRALALALDEQFRIRMQRLDGSAGRDGRPGTRRA